MKRRIISMALAAALSIGCIPVSAAELDIEQMLAEAAENIYQKGILRMKEKLKEKGYDEK